MVDAEIETRATVIPIIPICSDKDEDCKFVVDKMACWLYDIPKGRCPFLTGDKP